MNTGAIQIIPLTPDLFEQYIRLGKASYSQHYLHLWENQDPSAYFENAFRPEVVKQEWEDPGVRLFLIYLNAKPAGILKIILEKIIGKENEISCLFLERIYLLSEFTGKGVGKEALRFSESLARKNNRQYVCLEAMQKGPALRFYEKNGYRILGAKNLHFPGSVEEERPMYILGKEIV